MDPLSACALVFVVGESIFWGVHFYFLSLNIKAGERRRYEGGSTEPMYLFVAVSLYTMIPLLRFSTGMLAFANLVPTNTTAVVGAAMYAVGTWMFFQSHVDLGTQWSHTLELRDGHFLVKEGLYRYLRHPMYLGGMIVALAKTLVISNAVFALAPMLSVVLTMVVRVKKEEQMLIQEFGDEYINYMEDVGGLVPKFPLKKQSISQARSRQQTQARAMHSQKKRVRSHSRAPKSKVFGRVNYRISARPTVGITLR